MKPKIVYSKKEKILSLCFSPKKSVDSEIRDNVVIDYDKKCEIVNIDIMSIHLDDFVPIRFVKALNIDRESRAIKPVGV